MCSYGAHSRIEGTQDLLFLNTVHNEVMCSNDSRLQQCFLQNTDISFVGTVQYVHLELGVGIIPGSSYLRSVMHLDLKLFNCTQFISFSNSFIIQSLNPNAGRLATVGNL